MIRRAIDRFTTATTDVRTLSVIHLGFCGGLLLQLLWHARDQYHYFATRPSSEALRLASLKLLGLVALPRLPVWLFLVVNAVLLLSLLCAIVGYRIRLFLALALVSAILYFNQIFWYYLVVRKTNIVILVLLILPIHPQIEQCGIRQWRSRLRSGDSPRVAMWPIVLAQAALASMYFAAGVSKLKTAGLVWGDGLAVRGHLLQQYLYKDVDVALVVASYPNICLLASIATLAMELTFPLILLWPRLRHAYLLAGLGFHLATDAIMQIYYIVYAVLAYFVLFDYEVYEAVRGRIRKLFAASD